MKYLLLVWSLSVIGARVAAAESAPGTATPAAADAAVASVEGGMADVAVNMYGTFIVVDVSVNGGPPQPFILDTGAGGSLVDLSALPGFDAAAAPPVTVAGVSGEQTFAAVELDDLAVGGAHVKHVPVAAGDLGALGPMLGVKIGGILGYDFLRHFVLAVDYDAARVRFYDPGSFRDPDGVEFLPAHFDGGHPVVAMDVDSHRGRVVIDLGNTSSLILNGDFVARAKLLEEDRPKMPATLRGAGGPKGIDAYTVRMDAVRLGSFTIAKPVVVLPASAEPILTCHLDTIGNAGYGLMSRFTCYFDYPGGRLGLIAGKRFDAPFDYNRAGVVLRPGGDHYVVEKVMAGCAAASLVKPGDKVVAINGKAAAEVPPPAWVAIWSQPAGADITFSIAEEGGKNRDVRFKLADLL